MSLHDRTRHIPFSNGTEGYSWMAKWCDLCTHDHGMHDGSGSDPKCDLIGSSMLGDDVFEWPEAWLPEPDDGSFSLPSRLVCLHFSPCEPCGGDPGATERAERIDEVRSYWRANA